MQEVWRLTKRYWFDVLVVLVALWAAAEVIFNDEEGALDADAPTTHPAVLAPLMIATVLPLLARRRWPFAAPAGVVLGLAAISFVDGRVVPYVFVPFIAAMAASFLFGMLHDERLAVAGLALVLAMPLVVAANDPQGDMGDVFFPMLAFAIFWGAGFAAGRKFAQATDAEERAALAEREREERALAAVADERARIARELHDLVGHSVSLMTVQAGAVRRLLTPEQQREREALEIVEQTGREALAEMRRLVGILRRPEEAPALAPQPSLEYLDALVAKVRDAGLPVELRIEGDATELPPGIDLTAYRLVQEGLTNALKHAQATRADVLVRYGSGDVEIVVSDDGRGAGSGDGGGHGLVGMRERVSVFGGDFDSGPRPGGGYALRARLPMQ
jgi:signal transduction histidine kinase